jgi:hypothetical protein
MSVACSRCHVNGVGSPSVSCTSCHGRNHGGLTDCARCHTQGGWRPATFRHGSTGMPGWQRMACSRRSDPCAGFYQGLEAAAPYA